jgi:ATP-binding cassette subfamily B (MDR/TAP) protein 1
LDRFKAHLQIGFKSGMRKAIWSAFFAALYNFVIFGSMGVLFWYGSNLAIYGFSTPGTVQAIFWLFAIGAIRVGQAAPSFSSVMHARLAASELFIVIDRVG